MLSDSYYTRVYRPCCLFLSSPYKYRLNSLRLTSFRNMTSQLCLFTLIARGITLIVLVISKWWIPEWLHSPLCLEYASESPNGLYTLKYLDGNLRDYHLWSKLIFFAFVNLLLILHRSSDLHQLVDQLSTLQKQLNFPLTQKKKKCKPCLPHDEYIRNSLAQTIHIFFIVVACSSSWWCDWM